MTCIRLGGRGSGFACQPTMGRLQRQHGKCHGVCESESRIVMTVGSPYFGPDWHCVDCGDSWSSEGRYPRPFERAWRKRAVERYERLWERACVCPVQYDADRYPLDCSEHETQK